MKSLFSITPDRMHHAYCFVGNTTEAVSSIEAFLLETLAFPIEGNPDYWKESYESFGIEESRALSDIHRGHPIVWSKRIIVIECNAITHEAQNALLKVLEEPVAHTHFFIVIPKASDLLPTVRSRLEFVHITQSSIASEDGESFLDAPLKKRLDIVSALAEGKNKKHIELFFQSLTFALRKKIYTQKEYIHVAERVMKAHAYVKMRGASIKSILEHIAISVSIKQKP